jgi:hypothetical protein
MADIVTKDNYEPRNCFKEHAHDAHIWDVKTDGHAIPHTLRFYCDGSAARTTDAWDLVSIPVEDANPTVGEREDMVNHPSHYNSHPSGIEFIEVGRHFNFNIGSAIKYLWRNGIKKEDGLTAEEKQIEDLKKAIWYITDEIKTLEKRLPEKVETKPEPGEDPWAPVPATQEQKIVRRRLPDNGPRHPYETIDESSDEL